VVLETDHVGFYARIKEICQLWGRYVLELGCLVNGKSSFFQAMSSTIYGPRLAEPGGALSGVGWARTLVSVRLEHHELPRHWLLGMNIGVWPGVEALAVGAIWVPGVEIPWF
jgi:hypothetical protein